MSSEARPDNNDDVMQKESGSFDAAGTLREGASVQDLTEGETTYSNTVVNQGVDAVREDARFLLHAQHGDMPSPATSQRDKMRPLFEHIHWFLENDCFQRALEVLRTLKENGASEEEMHPYTEKVLQAVFLHTKKVDWRTTYPSLEYGPIKQRYLDHDENGDHVPGLDRRMIFKYDLIKSIRLSPAEQDRIIFPILSALLAKVEEEAGRISRGYSGNTFSIDHGVLMKICRLQYFLTVHDPDLVAQLQERVRRVAPTLLMINDVYALQEIGNSFGVKWHSESPQYAAQAVAGLWENLGKKDPHTKGKELESIVRLQGEYELPLVAERRHLVLDAFVECIGREDLSDRFMAAFSITPDEAHAAAIKSATRALEYSLAQEGDAYAEVYEGNFPFVSTVMQKYGVRTDELEPLARERKKLQEAIAATNCASTMDEWVTEIRKGKLRHYFSRLVHDEIFDALKNPDRTKFQRVQEVMGAFSKFREHYHASILKIFSTKDVHEKILDLHQPNERGLWKQLLEDGKTRAVAIREVRSFLGTYGLHPESMFDAWKMSSNDTDPYKEYMGTPLVFERNIDAISNLEKLQPGIAKHLSTRWGIHMFSRYPFEVLLRQYEQDAAPEKDKKKKKTVLVLFPQDDWNGAFERPELIQHIAKQAPLKTHNFCVAESGKRFGCVRRVARTVQRYGSIHTLVLGGHSDGQTIFFGPNPEDAFGVEHLSRENDPQGKDKHQEKIERIRSYLVPDGKIILKACSTGKEGGIAERISELFEIDVQGPVKPSRIAHIHLENGTAQYESRGKAVQSEIYRKPTFFEKLKSRVSDFFKK